MPIKGYTLLHSFQNKFNDILVVRLSSLKNRFLLISNDILPLTIYLVLRSSCRSEELNLGSSLEWPQARSPFL